MTDTERLKELREAVLELRNNINARADSAIRNSKQERTMWISRHLEGRGFAHNVDRYLVNRLCRDHGIEVRNES